MEAAAARPSAADAVLPASAAAATPHGRPAEEHRGQEPPDDAGGDLSGRIAVPLSTFAHFLAADWSHSPEPAVSCTSATLTRPRAHALGTREPPDPGVTSATPHRPEPPPALVARPLRGARGAPGSGPTRQWSRALPPATAASRPGGSATPAAPDAAGFPGRGSGSAPSTPAATSPAHHAPAHALPHVQGATPHVAPGPLRPDAGHPAAPAYLGRGLPPGLHAGAAGSRAQGGGQATSGGPLRAATGHTYAAGF